MNVFSTAICYALIIAQPPMGSPRKRTQEINDSGLTCQQIVAMGHSHFIESYLGKHPGSRKIRANAIFAKCKRLDNDVRAAKLAGLSPGLVATLRIVLANLQTSAFRMVNARSTKEELWLNFEAASVAEREDTCGKVIDNLAKPVGSDAAARAKAERMIKSAFQIIPALDAHKSGFDSKFEWSRYNNGLDKWRTSTMELNKLMARLPDNAAGDIADLVEKSLRTLQSVK